MKDNSPNSGNNNALTNLSNLPPPISKPNTAAVVQSFDDDGWGDDDWNFDDVEKKQGIDINSKEYKTKNLNKLSDSELAKAK